MTIIQQPKKKLHTLEEGQRVHYLANLGGLVAIAGLEQIEPGLLVGVLCEVERKIKSLPIERLNELKERGLSILAARNTDKRSFKTWQRAQQTERFDLTLPQMKKLIMRLGGKLPALDKDIGSELLRLFREMVNDK
jgi:hypothetical protein